RCAHMELRGDLAELVGRSGLDDLQGAPLDGRSGLDAKTGNRGSCRSAYFSLHAGRRSTSNVAIDRHVVLHMKATLLAENYHPPCGFFFIVRRTIGSL